MWPSLVHVLPSLSKFLITTLNICKQVPAGTQTNQGQVFLNHLTTTKTFASKWRRANAKINTLNTTDQEVPQNPPEMEPLKSILKTATISKDAYYHNLSEPEFDAKVKENTKANQVNKPSIKTILKKHDNLKTILKQAQEKEETNTSQMSNHKENVIENKNETNCDSAVTEGVEKNENLEKCNPESEKEGQDVEQHRDEDNLSYKSSIKKVKSVQLPRERVIDMSPEDQKQWEMEEMQKSIDLEKCNVHIDPSPFQLVERTSILKVHSLFSMVGINHAYVTKIGRLVGVVGLKELRKAIEDINSNSFVVQNQLKTTDPNDVEKSAIEKPLLPQDCSDKQVNITVTSMDSALSNSDNCSDIEMENIQHKIHPTPPPNRRRNISSSPPTIQKHSPSPPSSRKHSISPSPPPPPPPLLLPPASATSSSPLSHNADDNLGSKSSPVRDFSKD